MHGRSHASDHPPGKELMLAVFASFGLSGALTALSEQPWLWSILGALCGAVLVGGIAALSAVLWARRVRKVWNAPELSEGFFRRLKELPKRLGALLGGRASETGELDEIWHKFESQLPPPIRARLLDVPTVILLGGPRAGKTALIDGYVDWSSMQGQFLPSLRDETLPLRISLGSRILVQELASSVLSSDAPATAQALTKLWQPLCRIQQPLVIMAIDVNRLSPQRMQDPAAAELLIQEARMLVGKVSLLSRLCRSQLKVRICLTHMDSVPGFAALERFCNAQRLPLRVALHAAHSRTGGASNLLALYRRYLPLALLRSKAEDFGGIVHFLHGMPARLRALELYFEELVRDPTRRLTPTLDRLYFFSNQSARGEENPFLHATGPERHHSRGVRAWFTRLLHGRRHILLAAASALLLLIVLTVSFFIDGRRVTEVDHDLYKLSHAVKRTAGSHNPPYASSELHKVLAEVGHELYDIEKNNARSLLFRALRAKRKHQANELFIKAVRDSQLLPLLERYKDRHRDDLVLFTLAVLYGTSHNSLGGLVMAHLGEWAKRLELPPSILADYIHFSERPYEERSHTSGLFSQGGTLKSGLEQPHMWYEELVALEKYFAARSLEAAELARLREQLRPYLQVVDGVGKDPLVGQTYRVLTEVAPWSVAEVHGASGFSLAPPAWLLDQLPAFRGLLHLAIGGGDERTAAPQNLYQALRLLVDAEGAKSIPDEVFVIDLEGRQFSFSARQWLELLRRSRKGQVVRSLFNHEKDNSAPAHRSHRKRARLSKHSLPRVTFSSNNQAQGQNLYDGEVLRRDIVPILRDLDHKLAQRASLSAAERRALERFVSQESQRYARAYCEDLHKRYEHFFIPSSRVETTLAALRGLLQKDGALVVHLKQLAAGVDVGQLEGPYLQPLRACLNPFLPVARLASPDKDGNLPELKPYGELVAELIKQLEGPPPKTAEDGSKVELKDALPGAGRIALSMMEGQPENLHQRFLRYLQERQIPESLQAPLLAPLRHVQAMGESALYKTLLRSWEQGPRQQLLTLFELYPFRRDATSDATFADLELLKPQQGALWQSFLPIFGPVCVRQGGRWKARPLPGGRPMLPPDLLPLVNRAEEISRRLFSADGQRQKLVLSAAAIPPQNIPEGSSVVRSFVLAGKSGRSVFAPSGVAVEQELMIDWTEPTVAAVGVELQVGTGVPQTQSLEGPESPWSFLRLLERARMSGRVAAWRLAGASGEDERSAIEVSFRFNRDPFALFQTPRREAPQ